MEPIKEITCQSISEIESHFHDLKIRGGWLFRGQGDSRWRLATSLERAVANPTERQRAELFSFERFRRSVHLYEDITKYGELMRGNLNDFWLSHMQHHGVVTRVLDFTESVYIATYFAMERPNGDTDMVSVWALNMLHCHSQSTQQHAAHLGLPVEEVKGFDFSSPQNPPLVFPIQREIGYTRILIQQGWGMLPTRVDLPFMDNLRGTIGSHTDCIYKFNIPVARRKDILNNLYTMNIHRETLFPGVQGLGEKITISINSGIYK
jgi:FRG domain